MECEVCGERRRAAGWGRGHDFGSEVHQRMTKDEVGGKKEKEEKKRS